MTAGFFQNMAPSVQRSFFITVAIGAVASCIYIFGIQPCSDALAKARREHSALDDQKRAMDIDLRESERVKNRLGALDAGMKPYLEALLTPLLESWAMRAKSKLDLFAAEAGLTNVEYSERPERALPVPRQLPKQLYARRPIKVACRGSFAAVVSFVMRVEKELPLVTLTALSIVSQQDPDSQRAEITLEWPVKGRSTVAAASGNGKKKNGGAQ